MQRSFATATRMALVTILAAPAGFPVLTAIPQIPASLQPASQVQPSDLAPELRGDLAMARQQYLAAIAAYREAPSDSAVVWNKLGMAYHHLFAMDQARRDYQHALRLRPDYPEALNNLGTVYYAKKDFHKAVKLYRKALRLDPNSAPVYSNLGLAYFAERKSELGLAAYRTAFALNPKIFEANSGLIDEALPAHDRAQQDYCLAKLFAQSGHKKQAIEYLRKALNEGFDNRKQLLEDRTLASLRSTPEFAQLMTEQKLR